MSAFQDLAVALGRAPGRPRVQSEEVLAVYAEKRKRHITHATLLAEKESVEGRATWRNRRWAVLIGVNLLFTLSFWLDIQVLEGSLTASRFLGFHLADVYSSLLVVAAERQVPINLAIGAASVIFLWLVLGGRAFCAWVCPYHLLAEFGEKLHDRLAARGWVRDHALHRGVRVIFWLLFLLLAFLSGQTLFLTLNPIGILSRAVVYGPSLALAWVALLLLFEVLYSRRAWCRYVCPVGLTYGVLGVSTPVRVVYDVERCAHEGDCRVLCEVPHVLELTIRGRAEHTQVDVGPDCTRCGMCVDVCPTDSLRFEVKGANLLL